MALTKEIITANEALKGLTDAQIEAITTLSTNDENSVIGTRIGEVYRQMDATIEKATGIARNGDEKTYLYLERATKDIAEKSKSVVGLNAQIASLTKEKARLEKALAENAGDEETKKALAQAKKDLTSTTNLYNQLKADFEKQKTDHANEIFGMKISGEMSKAVEGIKFKSELPETATKMLLENVVAKVKGMNPEYTDDGRGGQTLAFKDNNGAFLRNPNNLANYYTAKELVMKELTELGVLAKETQRGTGSGGNGGNGDDAIIDVSSARTQTEAIDLINKSLAQQGLTKLDARYQDELNKAWQANNVSNLPEK